MDRVLMMLLAIDDVRFPRPLDSIPVELCFPSEYWLEDVVLLCLDRDVLEMSTSPLLSFLVVKSDGDDGCFDDLFPESEVAEE
jgi:hypothetical protein